MKRILLSILVLGFAMDFAFADDQADVDAFLAAHEVSGFTKYCRRDVDVPECRTLMTFVNTESGKEVKAFQIAFDAPARPFAATELFIPSGEKDSKGRTYKQYVDNTMDGTFTVASSGSHVVERRGSGYLGYILITGLPFGSLKFTSWEAAVILENGNEVSYPRMW